MENKDKQIGWLISLGIHVVVIVLFFFILAWQAPDPPLPEYGIELNFGLDQSGYGTEEPQVTPTPPVPEEVQQPEEQQPEEVQEVVEDEPQEEPVTEETTEEVQPDSRQEDSPVEAEPEVTPEPVPEKIITKEKTEPAPKPVEKEVKKPVEEPPKPKEKKVNANALYPGGASQGKTKDKAGNAGDEKGTVDARALYGKSGGGEGGPSLELAGWRWVKEPNPNDNSNENGLIVFEIKVDKYGEVIGVRTLEKTVSRAVEELYRQEIENLTFKKTSSDLNPAQVTTGKITFFIKSK